VAGAVHRYQMEALAPLPPWVGSPVSRVAPTVDPEMDPDVPAMSWALMNGSLAAGTLRPEVPVVPGLRGGDAPDEVHGAIRLNVPDVEVGDESLRDGARMTASTPLPRRRSSAT
jgi:hypothetical protein